MNLLKKVLFALLFLCASTPAIAQNLSGTVKDSENGDPLVGVSVLVADPKTGGQTDENGKFSLNIEGKDSVDLTFSYVGYKTVQMKAAVGQTNLEVKMANEAVVGQTVVVSASRVSETIMEAPVSIEKMDAMAVKNTAAVSFYDGLANLRGVDMLSTSFGFKTINTRGFASGANSRFVQRIDGMDTQAPGMNFSPGNIVGINDLDVASAELLPGAASALYGPNALNGVLEMTSKNPWDYPGLSVMLKGGMNHLDGKDQSAAPYGEAALRYAQKISKKFAVKVNFHTFRGTDWHANAYNMVIDAKNEQSLFNPNPQGADMLNIYGDEITDDLTLKFQGRDTTLTVARTGYKEAELVDYGVKSMKGDLSLYYRFNEDLELIASGRFGMGTTVYQGSNRYNIREFLFGQGKIELKGRNFFVRAYTTIEDAGKSYDSRFSAWNINKAWKQDTTWFRQYQEAYEGKIATVTGGDFDAARAYADIGRALPGTPQFDSLQKIVNANTDWKVGSAFYDKTKLYQVEGQYSFGHLIKIFDLDLGGSFRTYDLNSRGTIFYDTLKTDPETGLKTNQRTPIYVWEGGVYLQATKRFWEKRIRLTASLRTDFSKNFDPVFTPRFSAVISPTPDHNIRASFQTAFRYPTMQNQYINIDLGRIRLLAGLPEIWGTYNLNTQALYTLNSVVDFGGTLQDSLISLFAGTYSLDSLKAKLVPYKLKPIKPERVQSFELGYKTIIGKKLFVDLSGNLAIYTNFINNTRFIRMNTVNVDSAVIGDPSHALMPNVVRNSLISGIATRQAAAFQMEGNAEGNVYAYGAGVGLEYALPKNLRVGGNYTFSNFNVGSNTDPNFLWSFNTPKHKFNLFFSGTKIFKNFGFNVTLRWVDQYRWEASFGNGTVPSFYTIDAQVSYHVPKIWTTFKVGGANVTNNRHIEIFGGPTVGAMVYVQATFDSFLK